MLNVERLGVVLKPEQPNHAKFNAGMVLEGDTVHMLFRYAETAEYGYSNCHYAVDHVRYAQLDKTGKLVREDNVPLIESSHKTEQSGAQDPRIVPFEGEYYLFFTDYDGADVAQVGIAKTKDFKNIERLGVVPTKQWDKDAFIFPERINGKIAYVHRIEPDIQIDYFDTFEQMFDPNYWENYEDKISEKVVLKGVEPWESSKIGGSVPPIKTEKGWLIIYHGVAHDREPFCYRAGACLLDLNNPSKVVSRLSYPVLEPTEDYEINGDVNNVVFPQGAYISDGYLYISYGAADKYTAIARVKYDEFMAQFK